jgi:hypothetical protein
MVRIRNRLRLNLRSTKGLSRRHFSLPDCQKDAPRCHVCSPISRGDIPDSYLYAPDGPPDVPDCC